MDISELIKGGFKECWDFDDETKLHTCDWCGGTGKLKVPKKPVEDCGHCDGNGYIGQPVKTERDWSEELFDRRRDALRYRNCLHEINYAITVTNAAEDGDLPGITSAEMLERCFALLNGERDEIFD